MIRKSKNQVVTVFRKYSRDQACWWTRS